MTVAELLELAGTDLGAIGDVWLGYTESQGSPVLRERVAELYPTIQAEHLLTVAAPEEGIFIAMHALLEPGDRVVVLTPCYDSLANLARHIGCEVVPWPLVELERRDSENHGWRLDLEALPRLLGETTRLVVVNFPHNPTGVLPSQRQWQELVATVERSGAWLFSDEMYRGLEYDGGDRLPPGSELGERVLTLSGLSKTYGLPGLRCGWLAVRDDAMRARILGWKDYTTICSPAPVERLAEVALTVADRLIERSRRLVLANLDVADSFFARRDRLFRWNRPAAGPVALVRLEGHSARELSERLIEGPGLLLLPGTALGSDDRHVRFGLGRRDFAACLERLDTFLGRGLETRVEV
jgi:aspartate/methionine/tyrosine aminotransferase